MMNAVRHRLQVAFGMTTAEMLIAGVSFVALLPALAILPYAFPVATGVASASAVLGFNNGVAYWAAVAISVICICAVAISAESRLDTLDPDSQHDSDVPGRTRLSVTRREVVEILAVMAAVLLLYWPVSLARYGPYIEDVYALTAAYRHYGHETPYVNFDLMYGPLMYYIPAAWLDVFGYSMRSYYALIALVEAAQFGAIAYVLQRWYPSFRHRFWIFVVIAAFLFNTLLGLSYNGMRKITPVIIILMIARSPRSRSVAVLAGGILGMFLAYSHEYAAAASIAVIAMYGALLLRERSRALLVSLAIVTVTALVVWLGICCALLGTDGFMVYVSTLHTQYARVAAGEIAFPFYWTVNSLAAFALLMVTCVVAGRGIRNIRTDAASAGDLVFIGATVYALIALRSGLHRCDMWHVVSPFILIIVAFILPWERRLFVSDARTNRFVAGIVVVMAGTYLFALAPTASYFIEANARGMRDVLAGRPDHREDHGRTRLPSIEFERTHPDSEIVALGAYLADSLQRNRPVFLYGATWSAEARIGVLQQAYTTDDFLLSDSIAAAFRTSLASRPDALVIVETGAYDRLYGSNASARDGARRAYYSPTVMKTLAGWLSTTHYRATPIELRAKDDRWKRTVGPYLRAEFRLRRQFGSFTVLSRPN